jgi:hypothetical protein
MSEFRSEAQLQQACVIYAKNSNPELYGKRLFAVFNEGRNVTVKLGVGLTVGVCDLLYVNPEGLLFGYELKLPGASHSVSHLKRQCQWMIDVLPGRACFVDDLEMFKKVLSGDISAGISPVTVLNYLNRCKRNNIIWKSDGFNIAKEDKE